MLRFCRLAGLFANLVGLYSALRFNRDGSYAGQHKRAREHLRT